MSFDMSKTRKDTEKTRKETSAIHQSINNRPESLSDRLDGFKEEILKELGVVVSMQKKHVGKLDSHEHKLDSHGQKLDTHTKVLRGLDESIGSLKSTDHDLQKGLAYSQREFIQLVVEAGPMKQQIDRIAEKFLKG